MKLHCVLLLTIVSIVALSCSSKTEVSGEVFVVTQGAGNYKLGLVTVSAIPEKDVADFLARRDLNDQSAEADEVKAAQASLDENKELVRIAEAKTKSLPEATTVDGLENNHWAMREVEDAKSRETQADIRLSDAKIALLKRSWPESYFGSLPTSGITVKTDSDGKYKLTIPKAGRYLVTAAATRRAGGDNEDYYWAVWINADGTPQQLTLSNNNFAGPIQSLSPH